MATTKNAEKGKQLNPPFLGNFYKTGLFYEGAATRKGGPANGFIKRGRILLAPSVETNASLPGGGGNIQGPLAPGSNTVRGDVHDGLQGSWVQFMYNPPSITVTHQTATSSPELANSDTLSGDSNLGDGSADSGYLSAFAATLGSTGVELLFDRTYEVWNEGPRTTRGKYGAYTDVHALYRLLGIVDINNDINISGGYAYPSKPLTPVQRVWLELGDGLRYYGFPTNLDVSYTHFSDTLVPTRCSVSLGLALSVLNEATGAGAFGR